MNKRIISLVLAFVMILGSFSVVSAGALFDDVADDFWGIEAIEYLNAKDIMTGDGAKGKNTFRPQDEVKRSEFTKIVVSAAELKGQANISFSDVPEKQWFTPFISTAVANNVIEGYADNTFKPTQSITRQDALKIIGAAFNLEESNGKISFADADQIGSHARGYLNTAVEKGYIEGYSDNTFKPLKRITRAEAASLVHKILTVKNKDDNKEELTNVEVVRDIKKETVNGKDSIVIYTSGNVEIKTMKLSGRLVFDLMDTTRASGIKNSYNYDIGMNDGIRVSQFKDGPTEKVVRVVLDIKNGVDNPDVKLTQNKGEITITPVADFSNVKPEPEKPEKPEKPDKPGDSVKTIVLDAGHGGGDPGATGAYPKEFTESDINLQVTKKLEKSLKNKGYNVILTRSNDKDKLSLTERANIANENNADMFISIHCNSFSSPSAEGVEVFYYSKTEKGSDELADILVNEIAEATGSKIRGSGAKPDTQANAGGITVLQKSNMTAALIEMEFISNPEKARLLADDAYQNKIVKAITNGVEKYFKNN